MAKVDKKASKQLVDNIYKLHKTIDESRDYIDKCEALIAQNAVDYQRAVKHIADNDKLTEALKAHVKLIGQRKYYKSFVLGFISCIGLIYIIKGLSLLINLIF